MSSKNKRHRRRRCGIVRCQPLQSPSPHGDDKGMIDFHGWINGTHPLLYSMIKYLDNNNLAVGGTVATFGIGGHRPSSSLNQNEILLGTYLVTRKTDECNTFHNLLSVSFSNRHQSLTRGIEFWRELLTKLHVA